MAFLKGRIDGAYGIVDRHLAKQPFLVGGEPTIADFSLAAVRGLYPAKARGVRT